MSIPLVNKSAVAVQVKRLKLSGIVSWKRKMYSSTRCNKEMMFDFYKRIIITPKREREKKRVCLCTHGWPCIHK